MERAVDGKVEAVEDQGNADADSRQRTGAGAQSLQELHRASCRKAQLADREKQQRPRRI
jgi:hypothetical protein